MITTLMAVNVVKWFLVVKLVDGVVRKEIRKDKEAIYTVKKASDINEIS